VKLYIIFYLFLLFKILNSVFFQATSDRRITTLGKDKNLKYTYDFETDDDEQSKERRALVEKAQQEAADEWNPNYAFPDVDFYQTLSSEIYDSQIINMDDWLLLYKAESTVLYLKGFIAHLYFNNEKRQLALVVKGTSTFGNQITGLMNVYGNEDGGEIDSAFTFGEKVRRLILKFKSQPQLLITGHSLGGYLAQMLTYTVKNCRVDDETGHVLKVEPPSWNIHPHTVVFDSPPCFERIQKIANENPITIKSLWLDVRNFIKLPNPINSEKSLGKQMCSVVSVDGALEKPKLVSQVNSHFIANFADTDPLKWRQVVELANAETRELDARKIPLQTFECSEVELLPALPSLRVTHSSLYADLPEFRFLGDSVQVGEGVEMSTFVPYVRLLIRKHREDLKKSHENILEYIRRLKLEKDTSE